MPTKHTSERERDLDREVERELNADPITGEPGSHPVGTAIGAAAGGTTGAALGAIGGPIGAAVGAVIGAVAGGFAGSGVAEAIDPTAEDAFWRENHRSQPYAEIERPYEDYADAYRTGYTGFRKGQTFEEREADLRMEYEGGPQKAEADVARTGLDTAPDVAGTHGSEGGTASEQKLRWDQAREAARAAYQRLHRNDPQRNQAPPRVNPNEDVPPGTMID